MILVQECSISLHIISYICYKEEPKRKQTTVPTTKASSYDEDQV